MLKNMAFRHLQKDLVINMVKKLMDTATKTRIDAAKTASKRVVQKTKDAPADLTGNKIADKNTPASKTNTNTKELQQNERHKIYIPPEKR